jgi:hypothetical protein
VNRQSRFISVGHSDIGNAGYQRIRRKCRSSSLERCGIRVTWEWRRLATTAFGNSAWLVRRIALNPVPDPDMITRKSRSAPALVALFSRLSSVSYRANRTLHTSNKTSRGGPWISGCGCAYSTIPRIDSTLHRNRFYADRDVVGWLDHGLESDVVKTIPIVARPHTRQVISRAKT